MTALITPGAWGYYWLQVYANGLPECLLRDCYFCRRVRAARKWKAPV